LLAAYLIWYMWSHRYARAAKRVLKPFYTLTSYLLKSLGPLLGVSYSVVLHESHPRGDRQGWPYYNETARASQCVFTWHPHSALTVMPFTLFQPSEVFGRDVFIGVARPLYFIPILREILMVGNCRIADDHVVNRILEEGHSLMMQPGGVHEQVRFTDNHEIAYFSANLGFLRKAVRYGMPIIPTYSFGENQLYKSRPERRKISAFLSRLGLPAGLFCLPGKPLLVVGAAISSERLSPDEDEDAAVSRVFEMYLAALRSLWRSHSGHLPRCVAEKGLRFVYRSGGQGDVMSDADHSDVQLIEAFAARCRAARAANDAGAASTKRVPTLHVGAQKPMKQF